jgi:hypothetical protein
VEQKEAAVAKQQCGKHVSATTNKHTTIEELMEAVFPVQSVPEQDSKDPASSQSCETLKYGHESLGCRPKYDCAGKDQQ